MDPSLRVTRDQHRSRAAHYRRLAAEATTTRARELLLDLARQYEALADGSQAHTPALVDAEDDTPGGAGRLR